MVRSLPVLESVNAVVGRAHHSMMICCISVVVIVVVLGLASASWERGFISTAVMCSAIMWLVMRTTCGGREM